MELDLRIGAAFTRFQTMRLQKLFPESLTNKLVSYGSCQFPTMGFVVERFKVRFFKTAQLLCNCNVSVRLMVYQFGTEITFCSGSFDAIHMIRLL